MNPIFYRKSAMSLLCLCGFIFMAIGDNPDPERFRTEIEAFQHWDSKNATPMNPVLFIGSSSIRLWQTHNDFPNLPVINRGFGGSHISDVNHFIEILVLKYKPALIVFYAGDNDIADGKNSAGVFSDYVNFVQTVHAQLPQTRIIYLPIKPSPSRWQFWPAMQETNARIEEFCENESYLFYIDTATPMLGKNMRPISKLFVSDSLHLSQPGYALWTELLSQKLEEISGR